MRRRAWSLGAWLAPPAVLFLLGAAPAAGKEILLASGYLETRPDDVADWTALERDGIVKVGDTGKTSGKDALLVLTKRRTKVTVLPESQFTAKRRGLKLRKGKFLTEKDPDAGDEEPLLTTDRAEFVLYGTVLQLDVGRLKAGGGARRGQEHTLACTLEGLVKVRLLQASERHEIRPGYCREVYEDAVGPATEQASTPGFERLLPRLSPGVSVEQAQVLLFGKLGVAGGGGGEIDSWIRKDLPPVVPVERPVEAVIEDVTDGNTLDVPVGSITIPVLGPETPSQ